MPLYLRVNDRKGQHTKFAWAETLVPKDEVYVGVDYKLVKQFVTDHAHRSCSMTVYITITDIDAASLVTFNNFSVNGVDTEGFDVRPLPHTQWQTSLGHLRDLVKEFIK